MKVGATVHPTAIVGFQPMRGPTFARPTQDQPEAELAWGVVVAPYAIIYAGAKVGEDTMVCPYAHIREGAIIGKRCVIGVGVRVGHDTRIGDDVKIMDDAHISGGTIIGDRCFVAQHVCTANDDKPRGYVWKGITPVTIGSDCVIGAGAALRPGIKIGDGATVAMGAIVTRDVPPGAVVKGMRAEIVPSYKPASLGPATLGFVSGKDFLDGLPRQVFPSGVESVG